MTVHVITALGLLSLCLRALLSDGSAPAGEGWETVLDRKVHLSDPMILGVPDVPPLCDEIPGLIKERVPVEGGSLYCEIEGEGTPMVLLAGGPGCSHQVFHPYFSRAAAFAQVIYYDPRGVGQSDQDPTGEKYTMQQAVEDLDRLRAELKIDKWVVVGHSYGGFVAQCYALEHPEHVLGLVLIAALPGTPDLLPDERREHEFMTEEEQDRIRAIWSAEGATEEQRLYSAQWNGDWKRQHYHRPTEAEMARTARYGWTPAPGFRDHIIPDILALDLTGLFADFDIPTLLLEARWDLSFSRGKPHTFRANHPHGQLIVFEQAGHSLFLDEPDRFFSVLVSFVSRAKETPLPARMPTHRIAWPPPVPRAEAYFGLGLRFCDGGAYEMALECFARMTNSPDGTNLHQFGGLVWQGHALDLLGRRDEALAQYREALQIDIGPGSSLQCGPSGLTINRAWVEERLVTPFARQ